ncbi:hypothetical protein BDV25DRAFT_135793 [Aspergillus avenaceus]|uniref:Uncharacterized protein n=1 Tax=Aspergillus avenaceus TaxID=36643 RepID=A0A5N6U7Q6_ASPAV|nr:hypothetical protein BDV25DRAFT_135793 [Aspergillus avenaceus]
MKTAMIAAILLAFVPAVLGFIGQGECGIVNGDYYGYCEFRGEDFKPLFKEGENFYRHPCVAGRCTRKGNSCAAEYFLGKGVRVLNPFCD